MNLINPEILREYDIRGIFNNSLTLRDISLIASKISSLLISNNHKKLIIGHDGRESSLQIKNTLINKFISYGIDVEDISLVPTPVSYFMSKNLSIPNSIMITGSHNPKEYNGLKITLFNKPFFGSDIKNLNNVDSIEIPPSKGILSFHDAIQIYSNKILSKFKNINNLKIVWDPGNGAIGSIIHKILDKIGGEHYILNRTIDGEFPNHHPDPTVLKNVVQISNFIKGHNYDLGIAFDGDGDRVGVIDDNGNLVYSDIIFLLLTLELSKKKQNLTAIADIKCSKILFDTLKQNNVNILISKTGHSLIKEMIEKEEADIAGEMSGHIFYKYDYYGYDDAIYASLKLIELINTNKKKLSQLTKPYSNSLTTPEIKLYVSEDKKVTTLHSIMEEIGVIYNSKDYTTLTIDGIRLEGKDFWFLIRASNTQNCLVFRLEHFIKLSFKEEIEKLINILSKYELDIHELIDFNNTV